MPPKQTKKQTSDNEKPLETTASNNDTLNSIKKEWADNVKEILSAREKLSSLEKRNEDIISKLWTIMHKNPSEQVIIETENKEEEKKPVKSKKSEKADTETEETEAKPVAKVTKTKVTKKSETKPEVKPEVEEDEETPAPIKKTPAKNTKVIKDTKDTKDTKDVKETKKPSTPATKGKITAPSKGTPKPKLIESDDEKPKPSIDNDSSSDTEVDSLSSVSSDSDASGGEDD